MPHDDRVQRLHEPHVAQLTELVRLIRKNTDRGADVPFFDPADGGVNARVLFLFESPGPGAVKSGFVSRENPDGTARNFRELNEAAGLDRTETVSWNLVPWFIGTGGEKDRVIRSKDTISAARYLEALIPLLPRLAAIVLVGSNTWSEEAFVRSAAPSVEIFTCPMPSPLWVNRDREANRDRILRILRSVRDFLDKGVRR
ncbi:MAG: uracil-DNA glycosylase [Longimicrobiaceae bacterium]